MNRIQTNFTLSVLVVSRAPVKDVLHIYSTFLQSSKCTTFRRVRSSITSMIIGASLLGYCWHYFSCSLGVRFLPLSTLCAWSPGSARVAVSACVPPIPPPPTGGALMARPLAIIRARPKLAPKYLCTAHVFQANWLVV
jgi:hypothetical protein